MKRLINTTRAAERLGRSPNTIRALVAMGYLSASTADGKRGNGKRMYFDADEVEAFAKGGAPAAQAYRDSQQPPAKVRRGRGTKMTA